jgi:pimeloyl-ACP methyl ester carboxylesterase
MKNLLIAILFILLFACQAPMNDIEGIADIGTHRLEYRYAGKGKPTIVLDTGAGETFESYQLLSDTLSQHSRVFVYNRAGYGASEPGPLPRDGQTEARELKALLEETEVQGPYLIVGHSLGGLNMQLFADTYPEDVFGMVLLDPPPLGWITGESFSDLKTLFWDQVNSMRQGAEALTSSDNDDDRRRGRFLEILYSEHERMMEKSGWDAARIASFGTLPLTVIAAGRANPLFGDQAEAYQVFWIEENRKLARKSEKGQFILAEDAGHYIHRDAPEIVIDVILELIDQ